MQTQSMVAEQMNTNRYSPPAPLASGEITMTIRVALPSDDGTDVSIHPSFVLSLPQAWEDLVHQRLYDGVHGGLASVGEPLPPGGLSVHITRLQLAPMLESENGSDEGRRWGETLEAPTASTVAALWTGLSSLGAQAIPRRR